MMGAMYGDPPRVSTGALVFPLHHHIYAVVNTVYSAIASCNCIAISPSYLWKYE
jgi:hypothetical protein